MNLNEKVDEIVKLLENERRYISRTQNYKKVVFKQPKVPKDKSKIDKPQ